MDAGQVNAQQRRKRRGIDTGTINEAHRCTCQAVAEQRCQLLQQDIARGILDGGIGMGDAGQPGLQACR